MSNKVRFSALAFDSDSEEEDPISSGEGESSHSFSKDDHSMSIRNQYNQAIEKEHVYSVDTIRSYHHNHINEDIANLHYRIETISYRRFGTNRSSSDRRRPRRNQVIESNGKAPEMTAEEKTEMEATLKEGGSLYDTAYFKRTVNSMLETLIEETQEKGKQYERMQELHKKKDLDKEKQYHVIAGLDPIEVIKQSIEGQHIALTSSEISQLCSSPAICQEVEEEQASEIRPWRYIDIHGMQKGPYTSYEMRLLWEEGLISDRIKFNYCNNGWKTFYSYYHSSANAFIEEPTCGLTNRIPKTVRSLMRQREMVPVEKSIQSGFEKGLQSDSEKAIQSDSEKAIQSSSGKAIQSDSEKAIQSNHSGKNQHSEKTIHSSEKTQYTPKNHTLPVVHLALPKQPSPEPIQPIQPITPPANAVSLDEALSLQTIEMENHEKEEPTPTKPTPLPTSSKDIPTLSLERDAPRILNDTAMFYVEEAPEVKEEPPKPKKPIISPWTKQRLDQKPVIDTSINYTDRVGCEMEEEPVSVWNQTAPKAAALNYSNTIAIALPFEEEKKSWKPVAVQEAIPLEELLREEKKQKQQQKEMENEMAPKPTGKKGKKGKKEWKPVDLSFKSTPTSVHSTTIPVASGVKSFKQIQEEQLKEQKKETAVRSQSSSRGSWASLFNSPLPALGSIRTTRTVQPAAPVKEVEEESFWEVAKKKVEAKETKKIEKKEARGDKNRLTREEFDRWCRNEMLKLSGSDDISLLDFCISLDDSQVLSYLQDYLGQSRDVTNFAKSFIQKKQHVMD